MKKGVTEHIAARLNESLLK